MEGGAGAQRKPAGLLTLLGKELEFGTEKSQDEGTHAFDSEMRGNTRLSVSPPAKKIVRREPGKGHEKNLRGKEAEGNTDMGEGN